MSAVAQLGPDGSFHSLMVPDQGKHFMSSSGAGGGGPMASGQFKVENPACLQGRGVATCSPSGGGFQISFKDPHGQEGAKFICDHSPVQPSGNSEGFWVED
ncbi:hypothetical protein FRC12_023557 [Ceratobasidium sp. 428]|nr:hypothetical protein FRC12_023557 [Ceratobasidium sp. 428]